MIIEFDYYHCDHHYDDIHINIHSQILVLIAESDSGWESKCRQW